MFDIKLIRDEPAAFDAGLKRRGLPAMAADVLNIDKERRRVLGNHQEMQRSHNSASKLIGEAIAAGNTERADNLKRGTFAVKQELLDGEEKVRMLDSELNELLSGIPNIPLDETPDGLEEADNVVVRRDGKPRALEFDPKQHFELGEELGLMDFDQAAKMSGSRFVVLKGPLARLERAIGQFMLDLQTGKNGYTEMAPPLLVRDEALYGTGQLPKFADDLFHTTDGRWLIPTAEVSLTNLVNGRTLEEANLPMRVTALTPCFRAEAGAAGRDTRGMIRQHQFSKVEMVSITTPQASRDELDRMTGCAEDVLKTLGLPYKVMALSCGDMGFGARLTYDIEVWLPGQDAYREISSCSVCGDFQARRMNARYRPSDGAGLEFVHTLNGSGLAVGRTLIAVMENYQQADGSITIPEALVSYMGGVTRIGG